MSRLLLAAAVATASLPLPAAAQTMPGMAHDTMPAMDHGSMAGMDHGSMPGMDHGAMAGTTMPTADASAPAGTDLPPGNAPAPAPPRDHYADRHYGAAAMAPSRAMLREEHGGGTYSQLLVNLAEVGIRSGRETYRWDSEAWIGGDTDRLVLKSEGRGAFHGGLDHAEAQALYSHALDPYWNLQAGLRHDFEPNPSRTYATLGIEGLAPYWFEVEAALFLSDRGDLVGRLEAWHDVRLTQRLVLQPRAELNLAAQDVAETGTGSGLSDAELGLRLRYEVRRTLAPYLGIAWEAKAGDTARFARAAGDDTRRTSFVVGLRSWF